MSRFSGPNARLAVLTYRWCRNEAVADCTIETLVDAGKKSMEEMGKVAAIGLQVAKANLVQRRSLHAIG